LDQAGPCIDFPKPTADQSATDGPLAPDLSADNKPARPCRMIGVVAEN
jgi:hypothetical protein